jgi:hypothetical protein
MAETEQDGLTLLPDTLLVSLLSLLPLDARLRCSVLSRRWCALLRQPELYQTASFEGVVTRPRDADLAALCARAGASLRLLDLRDERACWLLTAGGVAAALQGDAAQSLVELRLPLGLTLRAEHCAALRERCPKLRSPPSVMWVDSTEEARDALAALPAGEKALRVTHIAHGATTWDAGAHALADALAGSTLAHLNLHGPLRGYMLVFPGLLSTVLLPSLPPSLRTLKLYDNGLGPRAAADIAAWLSNNSTLTNLDLCYNAISTQGCAALARALANHVSLTTLALRDNLISGAGATALADVLNTTKLRVLRLGLNFLDEGACQAIAAALHTNTTLLELDLSSNQHVGAAACAALAAAMADNTTLTRLDLRYCHLADADLAVLQGAAGDRLVHK